jgi:hypothetical protein
MQPLFFFPGSQQNCSGPLMVNHFCKIPASFMEGNDIASLTSEGKSNRATSFMRSGL